MFRRSMQLLILFALCPVIVDGAEPEVRRIDLPGLSALGRPGKPTEPVELTSWDAVKALGAGEDLLQAIKKQVDLEQERLLFVRWQGSGQDRLEPVLTTEPGGDGAVLTFRHQPGRTRDLRQHAAMFAVPRTLKLAHAEPAAANGDVALVKQALQQWGEQRDKFDGNYLYTVSTSSFSGLRTQTTITIRNNKVFRRTFQKFMQPALEPLRPGQPEPVPQGWDEEGDQLGSHQEGAPAITLDALYEKAEPIASRKLEAFEKRYVRTNKQGLLTSCFIIDTRIADDVPIDGLVVNQITLGLPQPDGQPKDAETNR
ncbi:MAG: hypothetical protein KDA58_07340 [Planctomycetaceae bacterium]|nr:hypothetical protein [Planctomycetaceae bacterium]